MHAEQLYTESGLGDLGFSFPKILNPIEHIKKGTSYLNPSKLFSDISTAGSGGNVFATPQEIAQQQQAAQLKAQQEADAIAAANNARIAATTTPTSGGVGNAKTYIGIGIGVVALIAGAYFLLGDDKPKEQPKVSALSGTPQNAKHSNTNKVKPQKLTI